MTVGYWIRGQSRNYKPFDVKEGDTTIVYQSYTRYNIIVGQLGAYRHWSLGQQNNLMYPRTENGSLRIPGGGNVRTILVKDKICVDIFYCSLRNRQKV